MKKFSQCRALYLGFAAIIACMYVCPAHAEASAQNFPDILKIDGAPIEPLCFAQCGYAQGEFFEIKNCPADGLNAINTKTDENGFIRTEYTYSADTSQTRSFNAYKPIGMLEDDIIIQFLENHGGTGFFSTLAAYTRENDTMTVKEILAAGDRCNGGLASVKTTQGAIKYAVNLTPFDIVALIDKNTTIQPYKDLEASAASCFATAHYENGELINVELTQAIPNENADWVKKYTYQKCYNALHSAYINENLLQLTPDELKTFTQKFTEICINNGQKSQNE